MSTLSHCNIQRIPESLKSSVGVYITCNSALRGCDNPGDGVDGATRTTFNTLHTVSISKL